MRAVFGLASLFLLAGCLSAADLIPGSTTPDRVALPASALHGPRLQVGIPSRNVSAPLVRVAVNGDAETWLAVDNISVSLRRGVLVASRGLGFDLMGADAGGTLEALAGRNDGIYRRQMRYLTGDHHSTYLMAGCSMAAAGSEMIEGRSLRRFEETCKARAHDITNIFWLDANGTVLRSRQWLSPEVGYLVISLTG